jgi:hypothetical protein
LRNCIRRRPFIAAFWPYLGHVGIYTIVIKRGYLSEKNGKFFSAFFLLFPLLEASFFDIKSFIIGSQFIINIIRIYFPIFRLQKSFRYKKLQYDCRLKKIYREDVIYNSTLKSFIEMHYMKLDFCPNLQNGT